MQRFDIMDRADRSRLYLRRWRLIQTPWLSLYLHRIYLPDSESALHDHPWPFTTIILRGGYVEEVALYPLVVNPAVNPWSVQAREWLPFSRHSLDRGQAHRIASVRPGTWTLLLVGRRARSWGFFTEQGWTDWTEYEEKTA